MDLFNLTLLTGCVTTTLQVAFLPPITVVTVIVAKPGAFAVTLPADDTVATLVLLDIQFTALFAVSPGKNVTAN